MRFPLAICLALAAPPLAAPQQGHAAVASAGPYDATPHLRVTPARVPTGADSARGDSLVRVARQAVSRYQSVEAAEESRLSAASGLEELGDGVQLNQDVASARGQTADARTKAGEARGALESLRREGDARQARLATIGDERTRWDVRKADAQNHIAELSRRRGELAGELTQAELVPEQIASKRVALLDAIALAEAARKEASDARQQAESTLAEADKHAKAADAALSAAREDRARAQALSEGASQRIDELRTRIQDELECAPTDLAERAEIKDGEELPPLEQAEKRVERFQVLRRQHGAGVSSDPSGPSSM